MSQILIKRSAVASKVPLVGDLALGELAINTTDGKLYLKKSVSGTESMVLVNDPAISPVQSVFGRTGAVTLLSSDVTTALTFTPYNATNPANYITSAGAPVQTVAGRSGAVVLSQADVSGLTTTSSPLFSAVTATTFNGALSGNATTATSATTAGNVTGTVAIANGGTGSTSAAAALTALGAVAKAGDTMTGLLTLSGLPATSLHAATKGYVDSAIAGTGANAPVQTVAGRTGAVVLSQADIAGLTTASSPSFTAVTASSKVTAPLLNLARSNNGGVANGISWYDPSYSAWCDYMAPAATASVGPTASVTHVAGTHVTAWAKRSTVENSAGYGWTFESGVSNASTFGIMAEISAVNGAAKFAGAVTAPTFVGSLTGNASTVSSITSGQVTSALTFTPYNATNPSLYLGKNGDIGASINFNTLTANGIHYQNSDAQAASCPNAPIGISGKLTVTNGGTSIGLWQEYETYNLGSAGGRAFTFKRQFYNSVWSVWKEQAYTDLVPAINPTGPKDGDVKVEAGPVISIYASSAWRQIFPATYS